MTEDTRRTQWETGRYGSYKLDLGFGFAVGVHWKTVREGRPPYAATVFGYEMGKRFQTVDEAKAGAERVARERLAGALAALDRIAPARRVGRCFAALVAPPAAVEPLNALADEIRKINTANGWGVDADGEEWWERDRYKLPAILALIHSEASEALEAFRNRDRENFAEELADVLIRVLDCASIMGVDMDREVAEKLSKNKTRGYRHGGKTI